jgi:hypothetical protein
VADLRPRTFRLVRDEDVTGVSGTGTVADGVAWPDGSVSVRWRGEHPSAVFWDDMKAVEHVHGHGGRTQIEWDDVPARSEADVLRGAADRFRRAAATHGPLLDDPDSKRWHDTYTEAADVLETWALNGGVPPFGGSATSATADEAAPEVDRG